MAATEAAPGGAIASGGAAPSTAEDAAVKKNTDCVYFLASPLTCKKGAECEFRHSEAARINPRDCWFWLSGTCLNRDCAYRHPPLEARTQAQAQAPAPAPAPQNNKGRTPCYYFVHGYCAKGDRCPFLHGAPGAAVSKAAAPPTTATTTTTSAPTEVEAKAEVRKPMVLLHTAAASVPSSQVSKPAASIPAPKPAAAPVSKPVAAPVSKPIAAPVSKPIAAPASKPIAAPTQVPKPTIPPSQAGRPAIIQVAGRSAQFAKPVAAPLHVDRDAGYTAAGNGSRVAAAGRSRSVAAESDESQSSHEDDVRMVDPRLENGNRDWQESSPGFDVLVDDGPDQMRYGDETLFDHENGGGADDFEFQYHRRMYNQTGGGFETGPPLYERERYDRISREYEQGEYTDYDAPYDLDRPQSDQPDRDYVQATRRVRTQSVKDRLRFNNHRGDPRPFLDNGDLRNVLERRRRRDVYRGRSDDRIPREIADAGERHREEYARASYFQQGRPNSNINKISSSNHSSGNNGSSRRSRERSSSNSNIELFHHRHHLGPESSVRRPARDPSPSAYEPRSFGHGFGRRTATAEEISDFAAPKSLAQIRAEKRKFDGDDAPVSSKRGYGGYGGGREPRFQSEMNGDGGEDRSFEAPKPLQDILKDKRRDGLPQFRRHDNSGNHDDDYNTSSVLVRADHHHHPDHGKANGVANHVVHADNHNNDYNNTTTATTTTATTTTAQEDEGFDDDDEDDFAKKLGGFFS